MVISIIGCGWLGMPLAKHLVQNGLSVNGSTTRATKLSVMEECGIRPFEILITDYILGNGQEGFFACDVLIINIPPGRKSKDADTKYPNQISLILTEALNNEVPWVIFVSSTSVYGSSIGFVTEETEVSPITKTAIALVHAEEKVMKYSGNWSILRLAGLIGPEREPAQWFAGKKDVPNGDNPVNLVHLEDCINLVAGLINKEPKREIYNLCSDEHPSRSIFYAERARKFGMIIPTFQQGKYSGKVISNQKIKDYLSYLFVFPDPLNI